MKGAFYTKNRFTQAAHFSLAINKYTYVSAKFDRNIVVRINIGDMQQKVTLWDPQGKLLLELF